jgi:hypothetical protein
MLRHVRSGAPTRDVPLRVGAVIAERLGHLDPPVRDVLERAAVLGREVDRQLLAELAGLEVLELRERLRLPLLTGILTEVPGGRLAFGHPLFRAQLEEGLEPARRAALHRAVGETVARRGTRGVGAVEETVAHHLLAALPEGDPVLAAQWAQKAGESAFRALAFERAVRFFEGALLALQRRPDAAAEVDLQLRLAETLARTGAGPRSRDLAREAADRARALGDPVRIARAALAYGAEIRIGVVDPVLIGLLEESLARVGETDPALEARFWPGWPARAARARPPGTDPARPRGGGARPRCRGCRDAARGAPRGRIGAGDLWSARRATGVDRELVSSALAAGDLVLAQRGYERLAIDESELADLRIGAWRPTPRPAGGCSVNRAGVATRAARAMAAVAQAAGTMLSGRARRRRSG